MSPDTWTTSFQNFEPIAHELKDRFPERWARFHSLPGSKRYPEDEAEYAIVLERHNAVLQSLARPSAAMVLLTTEFSRSSTPHETPAESPEGTWWKSVSIFESFWHVYASGVNWRSGMFDSLIRRVADDSVSNVMICDADGNWIVHPYDGGMDVFLQNSSVRDQVRFQFRDWLSSRDDGR